MRVSYEISQVQPTAAQAQRAVAGRAWVPGELYGLDSFARSLAAHSDARSGAQTVDSMVAAFVDQAKERGAHAENVIILLQDAVRRAIGKKSPAADEFVALVARSCLRAYYRGD
jgi:hypothetical protein